ncbi:MAG TPA: D-alanyl-D-alanine carboxypeptidase/D-alanyl-D-alanine-endopeptidase [Thiobacillaceae bacterium]|nr:D-alanyl-D-alanine carboxypeptidase/D-alanyl-D-alanine-endopeptidase [Thiobacillaceae bacterium]
MRRAPERIIKLGLGLCLALPPAAVLAELPSPVSAALQLTGIPDSHIGLILQEVGAPEPRLAHGELRSFNPASVMKLLTTLAALDRLGPAHTWHTAVLADAPVKDSRLLGNLILKGGGDPGLTLERFWLLLREIRARGIQHIQGDVILDNGLYAIEPADPGAFDQEPLRAYNAQPAALLVNHNALGLRLGPRATAVEGQLDPPALKLDVAAQTVSQERCGDWQKDLRFTRQGDTLRVEGLYPDGCGERQTWLNLLDPEENTAAVFLSLWRELGGSVGGRVRPGTAPDGARTVLEFASQPLGRLILDVNEYSNNVMAKMLFLNLGTHRFGGPATWQKGQDAVRAWLADHGLKFPELVLENGSGLSRIERISAASLARLLNFAATRPAFHEFVASLPALGQEGTLKNRLPDSPAAGRAWLKTGTLNGARNLAGYFMDDTGRRHILVLLINHGRAPHGALVQDTLIGWAFPVLKQ